MRWNEDVLRRAETVVGVVVIALILLAYLISKLTDRGLEGREYGVLRLCASRRAAPRVCERAWPRLAVRG